MSATLPDSSSRNRSVSLDEAGSPEHDRKRPRLEEGSSAVNGVLAHADTAIRAASTSSIVSAAVKQANDTLHTPPPTHQPFDTMTSPTSKVTINTRPLSSQSTNHDVSLTDTDVSRHFSKPTDSPATQLSKETVSSSEDVNPDTITIGSSPGTDSPLIEAAAVEDFDQDPSQTRWSTVGNTSGGAPRIDSIGPDYIRETFPSANIHPRGRAHQVVEYVVKTILKDNRDALDMFHRITDWLDDFTLRCTIITDDMLQAEPGLWHQLACLTDCLLQCSSKPLTDVSTADFLQYFAAFGRLTGLMMENERFRLIEHSKDAGAGPVAGLTCQPFLEVAANIIYFRPPMLLEVLGTRSDFNKDVFMSSLLNRLAQPGKSDIFTPTSELLQAVRVPLSKNPGLYSHVKFLLSLQANIFSFAFPSSAAKIAISKRIFRLRHMQTASVEFFKVFDAMLEQGIVKQHSWLSIDTARECIGYASRNVQAVATHSDAVLHAIAASTGTQLTGIHNDEVLNISRDMWLLRVYRKCIISGRMELRVFGITTFKDHLVEVYKNYIEKKIDHGDKPLVKFCVSFIQENNLVNYIIGVDSHPQLIKRSALIISFLSVAGAYRESDTDTIWQAVLRSQDAGTVLDVLEVLRSNFCNFSPPELGYIFGKLIDLPFERFDHHVSTFMLQLADMMLTKAPTLTQHIAHHLRTSVRTLCVRLVREASTNEYGFDLVAKIRGECLHMLAKSFSHVQDGTYLSWDEVEENDLLKSIAAAIEGDNRFACGSIYIMNCLLGMLSTATGILRLVTKCDYPTLLVQDIMRLSDNVVKGNVAADISLRAEFEARLQSLFHLILYVPDTLSSTLSEQLWVSLFNAQRLQREIKDHCWQIVTNVLKATFEKNSFFDHVINDLLPRLKPVEYSKAVLEFTKQSVYYDARFSQSNQTEQKDVVSIPGIERVWTMFLEAAPGTVEVAAADFIISMYLENEAATSRTQSCIESTHTALIDRCVQQVIASAKILKSTTEGYSSESHEPILTDLAKEEARAEQQRFDRSLLFLRKFIESIKISPMYSPRTSIVKTALPGFPDSQGERLNLRVQIFGSKYIQQDMQDIEFGSNNTGLQLWAFLCEASGFSQLAAYHKGARIDLGHDSRPLYEMHLDTALLIISKLPGSPDKAPSRTVRASSPVDSRFSHHFHDLYCLLESDKCLAEQVYHFFSLFPPEEEVVAMIKSSDLMATEVLPPSRPYKLLYCARTLRSCVEAQSWSQEPDQQFLRTSVQRVCAVLPEVQRLHVADDLYFVIVNNLLEAQLLAYRVKVADEISRAFIEDRKTYAHQLLSILENARMEQPTALRDAEATAVIRLVIDALVEASLHDPRMWDFFESTTSFEEQVKYIAIDDRRADVRRSVLEVVQGLTGPSGAKLNFKVADSRAARARFSTESIEGCLSHLWRYFALLVPHACKAPRRCHDFLESVLVIMRRIGKSLEISVVSELFSQWSTLLIRHNHQEDVGHENEDHVTGCLVRLLQECCKLLKAHATPIPSNGSLIVDIISKFLFPPLSEQDAPAKLSQIPILDTQVRASLYDLLLLLCQDTCDVDGIVSELDDGLLADDYLSPEWQHERLALRSSAGYAGLQNLSNTCYLNSLFSQLFMNLQFREFILSATILDQRKQKLVAELAKLFSTMQNSYQRAVPPSDAVQAIVTYDSQRIDVTVQMDVDEFFNLLFDRVEGQIIEAQSKEFFKSLYGGQLVQQIKSKECEHISEVLEPFSAVQVEIKGKTGLEDSLKAYVEGEVLQGDNKYSCTSCQRHVDAVKRACLKEIPDHLIFSLKRFDYDIMSGTRVKVHDAFQFPNVIDMAPYTLECLSNPDQPAQPDMYELTGVIVHTGTAETGHYYSFVRSRPSSNDERHSWVQFNDHEVTPFDPYEIADQCYGGVCGYQSEKWHSGYMLFYQRSTSIDNFKRAYTNHDAIKPVRLPLHSAEEKRQTAWNELYLRMYCVQDPSHARFVRQLLELLPPHDEHTFSEKHLSETKLLMMVLNYMFQVASRWKDHPEFETSMRLLAENATRCPGCAQSILTWFCRDGTLRDTIIRSGYALVRKGFAVVLKASLEKVAKVREQPVSSEVDTLQGSSRSIKKLNNLVSICVRRMSKNWDLLQAHGRAWNEYFGILTVLANMNNDDVLHVFDEDFLEKTVEFVLVVGGGGGQSTRNRYTEYLLLRERKRQYAHQSLIAFLAELLEKVDLTLRPIGNERAVMDRRIGPSRQETQYLGLDNLTRNTERLDWLFHAICGQYNDVAIDRLLVELCTYSQLPLLLHAVMRTLKTGLHYKTMPVAASFLQPSLTFILTCPTLSLVADLVQEAMQSIETIDVPYGKVYFDFVANVTKAASHADAFEAGQLVAYVLKKVKQWAPFLLLYPSDVRDNVAGDTVELLTQILFAPLDQAATSDPDLYGIYLSNVDKLIDGLLSYIQHNFIRHSQERVDLRLGQALHAIRVLEHSARYIDGDTAAGEEKLSMVNDTVLSLHRISATAEREAESARSEDWDMYESDSSLATDEDALASS